MGTPGRAIGPQTGPQVGDLASQAFAVVGQAYFGHVEGVRRQVRQLERKMRQQAARGSFGVLHGGPIRRGGH